MPPPTARSTRPRRPDETASWSRRRACAAAPGFASVSGARAAPPCSGNQTTNHTDQILGRARLAEVVVPQPVVRGKILCVIPGDDHERDRPRALVGPQLTRRLASVEPRQAHVHHDDVRSDPYGLVDGHDSIVRLLDVEP